VLFLKRCGYSSVGWSFHMSKASSCLQAGGVLCTVCIPAPHWPCLKSHWPNSYHSRSPHCAWVLLLANYIPQTLNVSCIHQVRTLIT
jgi:hypothetical protein